MTTLPTRHRIPLATRDDLEQMLSLHNLNTHPLVVKALAQSVRSHERHQRHDGSSYLEQHIFPVTIAVIEYVQHSQNSLTPELVAGSLLHDVLEDDSSVSVAFFLKQFGEQVYAIVHPLVRPRHPEKNRAPEQELDALAEDYLSSIEKAPLESKIIKLFDRLNNLACWSPSPDKRQLAQYERYYREIEPFYLPLAREVSEQFSDGGSLPRQFERAKKRYERYWHIYNLSVVKKQKI